MTEHRLRNLGLLIALTLAFCVPAFFLEHDRMLDVVSFLMLVFGIAGLVLITEETWTAFWHGARDRVSIGLYSLAGLLLTVSLMRTYGIVTRNVEQLKWLETTHVYAALVYLQFISLYLFFRASTPPTLPQKRGRWGQLVAGIIIGLLLASTRALEHVVIVVMKFIGRIF